eukprot:gnl/TRDRNA2_/TRDRNA2_45181_c0_seq1.p1 gnl/TRDRNA2_/TRDRNA2_45181_c0~~gnl/TRDRNA2_/TRDRNA2_45181_c0_seq1.p1  ORF type:complete len:302 (-),score=54.49 gnl/TRDRNA2_/TRDRNA2_45181_c0_seq1:50-955(-)
MALAVAYTTKDKALMKHCYWFLRETMCGSGGIPASWIDGKGAGFVRLSKGMLCHSDKCRTPLRVLSCALEEDLIAKRRWLTAIDGYTLCQVHRKRHPTGGYPHTYEVHLDHTDETILSAFREDEKSACRIYAKDKAKASASEHIEDYLGVCVPNFWGTHFTLYDGGSDVEALVKSNPHLKELPMRRRMSLCGITYETNILGECPRKICVDFERAGVKHHMENVQPRWDKKLNSYALPFFGRVKKASAKNFQLAKDGDINTIFLMFGKISKDVFCLDFRSPITSLDAMAIAIASLAKKRAVS